MPLRSQDVCYRIRTAYIYKVRIYKAARFDFPVLRKCIVCVSADQVNAGIINFIVDTKTGVRVKNPSRDKIEYLICPGVYNSVYKYKIFRVRDGLGNDDYSHIKTYHDAASIPRDASWADLIR